MQNEYRREPSESLTNISDQELQSEFEAIVNLAAEFSGCPIAYISFIDYTSERIHTAYGLTPTTIPRSSSLWAYGNPPSEPYIVPDITLDPRYNNFPVTQHISALRTFAAFPLYSADGSTIGALSLADYEPRTFSSAQTQALKNLADHAVSQLTVHHQMLSMKRTLSSLEDSEQRFRRIADASPVLLWISDISGHRTLSNKAWCDFTGLSEEESLAECWRVVIHPDDIAVYQSKWAECVKECKRFQHEFRLRHHSGTFRWVLEQAIPMFLSNGRLEAYISSCVDLSLRNSEELQYQYNEARFRAVSEAAPLGIVVTDSDGRCIYSNHKFQSISGLTPEESLGTGWLRSVHADDQEEMLVAWINATSTSQSFEKTFRFQRADGSIAWCSLKAASINSTDTVSGWVSTIEDITARRESDSALMAAKQAAESAMHAKNQFLANVSHEIRTPLTAILGFADALREDGQLHSEQLHYVDVILNNGRHLLTIINQILDLSKIDAGALAIEPAECDLMQLIDELLLMFIPTVAAKSLYLTPSYDWPLPRYITTDPLRLKQVLINLLSNAIKFTSRGGVTLGVSWDPAAERVLFSISDTGIGISAEHRKKLFTPFYQANESINRTYGGTGLGLSISHRLVKALGGTIEVQSEPGKGSTFTFQIQAGAASGRTLVNQAPTQSHHAPAAQLRPPTLRGRILFADDALDNRRLVEHLLKKTGAEITLVENGQEAIDITTREQFDLILMDIQMPVVDGLTATKVIRQSGITVPIVAISAGAMTTDVAKALEAGCSMHLSKPFERTAFYQMLRKFMVSEDKEIASAVVETPPAPAVEQDPEMAELMAEFVQGLPAKARELSSTAERGDFVKVAALAHRLKGSSGMYGFPHISAIAKNIEKAAKEQQRETLLAALEELGKGISELPRPVASENNPTMFSGQ